MNSILRPFIWLLLAAAAVADDSVRPDETVVFFPTCAHLDSPYLRNRGTMPRCGFAFSLV